MNREEYLSELKKLLSSCSEETLSAAVQFFDEVISDRMEEGFSEEKAVEMLDTPAVVAQAILEQASAEKALSVPPEEPVFLRKSKENEELQTAMIKTDHCKQLIISLQNRSLICIPSEDNDIHIEYYKLDDTFSLKEENGSIHFIQESPPYLHFGPGFFRHFFYSGTAKGLSAVTVRIPQEARLSFYGKSSNAALHIKGLQCLDALRCETSNGAIISENINAESVEFSTGNGRIELRHLKITHSLTAHSSNGSLTAQNIHNQKGDVTLTTSNSTVHAEQIICPGKLSIRTSNGAIRTEEIEAPDITLKTSNGRIAGTIKGRREDWRISSHTSNGKCNLPSSQPGEKSLDVRTSNGSIDIDFIE